MLRFILGFTLLYAFGCVVTVEAENDTGISMGLFQKSVSIDQQLQELKSCGIAVNDEVTESDLTAFETVVELEKTPYKGLVEVLGMELEREPYSPMANPLWMCDYERVEDHGAYKEIIERLELMTRQTLGLTDIVDYVDIDEGKAWVEFTYSGERVRWEAKIDNDWMDPYIIVKYDQLLKSSNSKYRIYSNHKDYGQVAFFTAFTDKQFKCFRKLSKIYLALIESQA